MTDPKIVADFFRKNGFNIPEGKEDQELALAPVLTQTLTQAPPSGYEVMMLALKHHKKISANARDHAIDWVLHFNLAARVAFTLPQSLSDCHTGICIFQDASAGPQ